MNNRPNILLITTDQQRFDTLGINGNAQIRTPNLDSLAGFGVNFANAFVQNTVCVPSRACVQTGRYTHQHGVTYMETVVDETPGLPESELTFMERLRESGYVTGASGKIHMFPEKGFDWLRLTGGKGQKHTSPPGSYGPEYANWLNNKRPGAYESIYEARRAQDSYGKIGVVDMPIAQDEYVEHYIAENAKAFIDERAESSEPFFLWCGFCGPHGPFDPPEPYRNLYSPAEIPLPLELEGWRSWREKWDEDVMRQCVAYYWAMVSCLDDLIGGIASHLKEKGIFDRTMIIFTSDHGEMLGERAKMGKALFYDSIIHVPTWVKPSADVSFENRSVQQITEVMNIAPTILDYAGVDIPETMTAHSWRPLIEGGSDGTKMIFSEHVTNDLSEMSKCVRTETHKYIRFFNSGLEEFYDLTDDPLESRNLAGTGEQGESMNELKTAMFDWLAKTEWRRNHDKESVQ